MKNLLLYIFIFGFYAANAQFGSIKGIVRSNNTPVEMVNVGIPKLAKGVQTDSNGVFILSKIPFGNHEIVASMVGFDTFRQKITISKLQPIEIIIDLKESGNALDEVVITGTMKEVSKLESPVPVEVYSPVLFKKNPTPSLFDAVGMINGVRPQLNCSVCNTGDIHINGMEGPYTMITIDGMPIVSSLSTVYGLSGIPNAMVQRIEVVKGPASTLYGSEAVGGLINVITKNPTTAPIFSFDLNSTSYQEVNFDASAKFKVGKKATSLLSANYFNFNKIFDINNDNFTDLALQNRVSVFNKWSFDRKQNRLANIAFRYLYEDRWGGQKNWTSEYRGTDLIYGESIYTKRIELIGNYQLPIDNERITLQYSFNNHDQNSVYGTTYYIANQKVAFGQLLWDKKFSPKHDALMGLAFRYTFYDDNTPATADIDLKNKPSNIVLPGVFVQDEIELSKKNKLLLGLRYDYNSQHESILTPRINIKHSLNPNHVFRLSAGTGYRVVNLFTEDHAALTGARKVVIKEELRPERSINTNLNYASKLFPSFGFIGFDASLFYTRFSNKIVGDYTIDPDAIIYDNLRGYAVSRGMTINSDFNFDSGLKLIAGFTWMDVFQNETNENGVMNRLPQLFVSKFSGNWAVSYTIPKTKLSFDLTGNVYSPMHLPVQFNDYRPDKSPWFSIVNFQTNFRFKDKFEVYGGIKNLLNFVPKYALMRPFDPFDKQIGIDNPNNWTFDAEYNFAPIQGIRGFLGLRYVIQ